jgi:uncharacterized membrane protein
MWRLSYSRKAVLCWIALAIATIHVGCWYLLSALHAYNNFELQTFDYGLTFDASQLALRGGGFMATRGVYSWAHNQQWFHFFLAPLHLLPFPHHAILSAHSLAILGVGIAAAYGLRHKPFLAFSVAFTAWLSPTLVNMNSDVAHVEAFATVLIVLMGVGALEGRIGLFYVGAIGALLTKVDVAFTVFALASVFAVWRGPQRISQRNCIVVIGLSLLFLGFNLGLAVPYFKKRGCQVMDPEFSNGKLLVSSVSGWFDDLFNNWSDLTWWSVTLLRTDILLYFVKLLWPLVFVIYRAPWIGLALLPGLGINIVANTSYLIENYWHYDHSTYAVVLIIFIFGLPRIRRAQTVALTICVLALLSHVVVPEIYRNSITRPLSENFWRVKKVRPVKLLEDLNRVLPRDEIISADYTSLSYLLPQRDQLYAFPNPIKSSYFGVFGVCEEFKTIRAPLVLVIREKYQMNTELQARIDRDYERIKPDGIYFDLYLLAGTEGTAELKKAIGKIVRKHQPFLD